MGTFSTSCHIQHIVDRQKTVDIPHLLVDTGSKFTRVPEKTLEALGVDREKLRMEPTRGSAPAAR